MIKYPDVLKWFPNFYAPENCTGGRLSPDRPNLDRQINGWEPDKKLSHLEEQT